MEEKNKNVSLMEDENIQIANRKEKLEELKANGEDPFQEFTYDVNAYAKDILEKFEDYEGKVVSLAGRIILKRVMGKASFAHIYDGTSQIQIYVRLDALPEGQYAKFKNLILEILLDLRERLL